MSRYIPFRDEWTEPCQHPKCEVLHRNTRRFGWLTNIDGNRIVAGRMNGSGCTSWHEVTRSEWVVMDTTTGDRADHRDLCDPFDTKRDAVRAIENAAG